MKTIVSLLISGYKLTAVGEVTLPVAAREMPMGPIQFEKRIN
jgi:hypothetical protein